MVALLGIRSGCIGCRSDAFLMHVVAWRHSGTVPAPSDRGGCSQRGAGASRRAREGLVRVRHLPRLRLAGPGPQIPWPRRIRRDGTPGTRLRRVRFRALRGPGERLTAEGGEKECARPVALHGGEKCECAGPGAPHGAWPLVAACFGTRGCRSPTPTEEINAGNPRDCSRGSARLSGCLDFPVSQVSRRATARRRRAGPAPSRGWQRPAR